MNEARQNAPNLDTLRARPSKVMLVMWALGECGGDKEFVDKLDVAVYAFRAYPAYFGFQKYPQYPDVDAVRVQLTDLVKPKLARSLGIVGEAPLAEQTRQDLRTKWRLTPDGVTCWQTNRDWLHHWVSRNANSELGTTKTAAGRVRTEDDAKVALINRIRSTQGYASWMRSPDLSRREVGIQTFFTSFGIGPRTSRPEYIAARDRIFEAAHEDQRITEFLTFLDGAFGEDYKRILSGEVEI